jgi:hypothetical protein
MGENVYKAKDQDPDDEYKMNNNKGFLDRGTGFMHPFTRQGEYTKKSAHMRVTYDISKKTTKSSQFAKDDGSTYLLQSMIALGVGRFAQWYLSLAEGGGIINEIAKDRLSGLSALAGGVASKDLEFQVSEERTYASGERWYGKVQYDIFDNSYSAIDYYGSEHLDILIEAKRYERIIDTKTGEVFMTNTYVYPINTPPSSTPLPKTDTGKMY